MKTCWDLVVVAMGNEIQFGQLCKVKLCVVCHTNRARRENGRANLCHQYLISMSMGVCWRFKMFELLIDEQLFGISAAAIILTLQFEFQTQNCVLRIENRKDQSTSSL